MKPETRSGGLALAAWLEARRDGPIPLASDLGPMKMKDFLPYVGAFRQTDGGRRVITVHGTALVEQFGFDATGRTVEDVFPPDQRDEVRALHDYMFEHGCLGHVMREVRNRHGAAIAAEQLLLPLRNDAGTHDRYIWVAERTGKHPQMQSSSEPRDTILIGRIVRRTLYDAHSLLPVACAFNTERPDADMHEPLEI